MGKAEAKERWKTVPGLARLPGERPGQDCKKQLANLDHSTVSNIITAFDRNMIIIQKKPPPTRRSKKLLRGILSTCLSTPGIKL